MTENIGTIGLSESQFDQFERDGSVKVRVAVPPKPYETRKNLRCFDRSAVAIVSAYDPVGDTVIAWDWTLVKA
jgi:hypothetical protein